MTRRAVAAARGRCSNDAAGGFIPDEGTVVVDLRGLEAEALVVGADAARGAGGGEDDGDAFFAHGGEGAVGARGDGFAAGQEGAVEVEGEEADVGAGGQGR